MDSKGIEEVESHGWPRLTAYTPGQAAWNRARHFVDVPARIDFRPEALLDHLRRNAGGEEQRGCGASSSPGSRAALRLPSRGTQRRGEGPRPERGPILPAEDEGLVVVSRSECELLFRLSGSVGSEGACRDAEEEEEGRQRMWLRLGLAPPV